VSGQLELLVVVVVREVLRELRSVGGTENFQRHIAVEVVERLSSVGV
jgi:hypothetical protein